MALRGGQRGGGSSGLLSDYSAIEWAGDHVGGRVGPCFNPVEDGGHALMSSPNWIVLLTDNRVMLVDISAPSLQQKHITTDDLQHHAPTCKLFPRPEGVGQRGQMCKTVHREGWARVGQGLGREYS